MTKVIAQKIEETRHVQEKIFALLALAIVAVFLMYGFLVRDTVLNVIAREKIGKEAHELLSTISSLEASYMDTKAHINLDVAYAHGFKDVHSPDFISPATLTTTLLSSRVQ